MKRISLNVNGVERWVVADPKRSLADVLREQMMLTGCKVCCADGQCGSCTVLMDGVPVVSCLVLASQIEGRKIMTVEGLAADKIGKALQEAFVEAGAVQCGYCIPGFLMSARALIEENPDPTLDQIKEGLSGNICRCTGYVKIFDAVALAARRLRG